ncbi:MAG TPA: glycoside hydrolase family 43 protein [Tepidisphaeraceae bacterium]
MTPPSPTTQAAAPTIASDQQSRSSFINADKWLDTDGKHINAHGGGVLFHDGVYYWHGESRPAQRGGPSGVGVYSSRDLYNWKNEGLALAKVDDESSDITHGCIIERPKVIYNARSGQFVMWFHLELKGRGYAAARTGLAVSRSPTGPFTFVRSLRPNAGIWPEGFPEQSRSPLARADVKAVNDEMGFRPSLEAGVYTRRDFEGGQMARDMTLYVDDDGKAYHIASAEENYTLNIHELNDDYTDFTGRWIRVAPGGHNEAPAVVKHNGKYYMLASGCTGWDPNPARVLESTSIWGPWKNTGNPCRGVNPANKLGPNKTFGGQSTFILPVQGKPSAYIAMFDVWRPRTLHESGHIWLPVTFQNDRLIVQWRSEWDLSVFQQ